MRSSAVAALATERAALAGAARGPRRAEVGAQVASTQYDRAKQLLRLIDLMTLATEAASISSRRGARDR